MNKYLFIIGLLAAALSVSFASDDGPPVGTQLDTDADGVWDQTYLGDGDWDPPLTEMPPPGTLVDLDGDDVADGVLVDQDSDGEIDGLDLGMDGTVDYQI